jgi:hypothetical protein
MHRLSNGDPRAGRPGIAGEAGKCAAPDGLEPFGADVPAKAAPEVPTNRREIHRACGIS